MRRRALAPCLLAGCLLAGCAAEPPPPRDTLLWAWERPEDLSFLRPGEAKVALLVATMTLDGERVEIYGRRQPLRLPEGLVPIPVVRLEARRPALSAEQLERLAGELAGRADRRASPALQIDFDARASERGFYRSLLEKLAALLGPEAPISITALASWCLDDRWLAGLPIVEAVPMLFDMGREGEDVLGRLRRGEDFAEPLCRRSYGLATYQPWPPLQKQRAIYLFADRPFTAAALRGLPSSQP